MAADYTEEPNCTQKGRDWISFEPKPKIKKMVKKIIRKRKL
jgi:hypothetical protein